MSNTFRLTFETNLSQNLDLNIPRANANATEAEIIDAMQRIVNSDAISTPKGRPRNPLSARLIQTEVTEFDV